MKTYKGILIGISIIASIALLAVLAINVVADYSVEIIDRYGFAEDELADGTIVQYIGDLNTTYGSAGTGTFNSFVRIQGNEKKTLYEHGYNTDGTPEFDTKGGKWTHSILLSEIPTILVGGELYWEFFADINESDSTPKISLDDFELWLTADPELDVYATFGANADQIYDYTNGATDYILINDVNQGSGRGDLRYLVPYDEEVVPENCNYGNPACATYLVLYSRWGGKGGDYKFDGGFEEWKVKQYPILQVSKTIDGSYDTPVTWTIDKTPDATYKLFTGESQAHEYTVSVNPVFGDPENVIVYGTITIHGDDEEAVNATIEDEFEGEAATITGCSVTANGDGTYTIAAGATVTCSYELEIDEAIDGTNIATASYEIGTTIALAFQGSADILASEFDETLTGKTDINVTDSYAGALGTVDAEVDTAGKTFTYQRTFTCDTDKGTKENTATITETGQTDKATVVINCYALTVTKTADEFKNRKYLWDITKSVTPETWNLFTGESGTSDYTVDLDQTGYTDNEWQVKGSITITNPHPDRAAELTQVLDNAGGITANVSCPSLDVPKNGGTLICTYDSGTQNSPDVNPFGSTNTATATQQLYTFDKLGVGSKDSTKDYQGTQTINFGEATVTAVDEEVEVDDTYLGSTVTGKWTADHQFTYSRTFTCDTDKGKHDNTASFTSTDSPTTGSDDASVTVNCYDLDVTKTAVESFKRTYTWEIDKSVDNPGPITVASGDSVTLNYTVEVDLVGYADSEFGVTGNIVITNNHPSRDATLTGVTDLAGTISGVVTCPPLTVPKNGGTLTCTYTTALQTSATPFGSKNTATATQQLYTFNSSLTPTADGTKNYSGEAAIDFAEAAMTEIDESIDVTDSYAGFLGTVDATDTLPKSFTYPRLVTAPTAECGEFIVDNTAEFETNDTHTTGDDEVSVTIHVPCGEGCTPGFWQGGAGRKLWNEVNDPDWVYGGVNPFIHTTLFNDFFDVLTDARLDGKSMMDLVSTGGTENWAIKAARDMVAAYLNESAFPGSFPATSLGALEDMWYAAVDDGDAGFEAFHTLVSGWNDPETGICPLP